MQLFIYLFASVVALYYTYKRDFGAINMTYSNFVKKKKNTSIKYN